MCSSNCVITIFNSNLSNLNHIAEWCAETTSMYVITLVIINVCGGDGGGGVRG